MNTFHLSLANWWTRCIMGVIRRKEVTHFWGGQLLLPVCTNWYQFVRLQVLHHSTGSPRTLHHCGMTSWVALWRPRCHRRYSLMPREEERRRSGGDRARTRVLHVCGLVLVSGLSECRVGAGLVQVDVGDVQTDVVLPLQAGQDGRDGGHKRGKVGPQLRIGVPALEHNVVPGATKRGSRSAPEGIRRQYILLLLSLICIIFYFLLVSLMLLFPHEQQTQMVDWLSCTVDCCKSIYMLLLLLTKGRGSTEAVAASCPSAGSVWCHKGRPLGRGWLLWSASPISSHQRTTAPGQVKGVTGLSRKSIRTWWWGEMISSHPPVSGAGS